MWLCLIALLVRTALAATADQEDVTTKHTSGVSHCNFKAERRMTYSGKLTNTQPRTCACSMSS